MSTQKRFVRFRDPEAAHEMRCEIISHIRSHGPIASKEICEALDMTKSQLEHQARYLSQIGCIAVSTDGGPRSWVFVQTLEALHKPQTPTVGIKAQHKFCEPGPVIKTVRKGVKYTYCAAPRDRFHVDLKPGTGVISQDNERLAALAG